MQEVKANPNNYDAWFDYLRLVESEANWDDIRDTYERAIANVPPTKVGLCSLCCFLVIFFPVVEICKTGIKCV